MTNIIFLDVDGPMIPGTARLLNNFASPSQILDDRCVAVLHKIVKDFDAQIVFNSYHNLALYGPFALFEGDTPGLVQRFIDAGFEEYIHPSVNTVFPEVNIHFTSRISRIGAIIDWLNKHPESVDSWVAFDDEYINHQRAYQVNESYGIGLDEYKHARKWFKKMEPVTHNLERAEHD